MGVGEDHGVTSGALNLPFVRVSDSTRLGWNGTMVPLDETRLNGPLTGSVSRCHLVASRYREEGCFYEGRVHLLGVLTKAYT